MSRHDTNSRSARLAIAFLAAAGVICGACASMPGGAPVPPDEGRQVDPRGCRPEGAWTTNGTVTTPPSALRCVFPRYPVDLRDRGVGGDVIVRFLVDSAGVPDTASFTVVLTSAPQFATAFLHAMAYVRFAPAAAGEPRPVVVEMRHLFTVVR